MKFTYKAQKKDGVLYEGSREAQDKYALARELEKEGETLIVASPEKEHEKIAEYATAFLGRVSVRDRVIFARNLGGMLTAGLSLSRALTVLERQTNNRKLKQVLETVSGRIAKGEALSEALSAFPKIFSALFISMVRAGEESGNVSTALLGIGEELDRTYMLQRKVRGALMYPGIIISVMVIIGILLFIYVVPQLTATFKEFNVDLPLSTEIILWVSDFLKNHLFAGLIIVAGAGALLIAGFKHPRGKRLLDYLFLHIPVISPLVKEANTARVGHTLSSLLSAGVPVVNALEITSEVLPNTYYKEVLITARETVKKGDPISAVFRGEESIYPPFLSEMVAVGEETGKLAEMLKEAGSFFEGEVDQKTKDLSTIIEPLLMVIVGAGVGFFALAMITPIYSLMGNL